MGKTWGLVGLGALALLFLVLEGCAGRFGGGERLSNQDLTFISFGSLHGELLECG